MQKKAHSILEAIANTIIGMAIALVAQVIVFPLFDIHVSTETHIGICIIFTMVSLIRSYILRRLFNSLTIKTST